MFPWTGSAAGQATLNSSAGIIVSEVDRVRPRSSLQHEDFVSVGHAADTGSTNPCHALGVEPCMGQRLCVKGASPFHDLNTD